MATSEVFPLWATIPLMGWGIAVASWFGGIVEIVLTQRLWPAAFRVGYIVLRKPFAPLEGASMETDRVHITPGGKFRFVNHREVVCCSKFWREFGQWYTPFPIKGRITWSEGTSEVGSLEGRIPIGPMVFMGGVLVFATSISIFGVVAGPTLGQRLGALAMGGAFWGFAAGMYLLSLRIEMPRIFAVAQEVREQLSSVKQSP